MEQQISLLEDVKSQFDHWRGTRTKRGRIPDYLWDKVKQLIGRYPLTTISEKLSLNTNQIRERLALNNEINFVEVKADTTKIYKKSTNRRPLDSIADKNKQCSIELHKPNGSILKIHDLSTESLSLIITTFIG